MTNSNKQEESTSNNLSAEQQRLADNTWKKWGPYVSERQWGTVREDYSENGDAWNYFTHEDSRSRTYRWGEDGIAGICDSMQHICFAIALWNGKDPILKERLFGLSGPEGNHGEDVKELYYYLDSTPTHSYMKHLYKYPQNEFPYKDLLQTNESRGRNDPEYELLDTGIFNDNKYFDVFTEYAKNEPEDVMIRISIHNRAAEDANISLLPTLWMRNMWSFGLIKNKPVIELYQQTDKYGVVKTTHEKEKDYYCYFETPQQLLFTENETNNERIFNLPNNSSFVKDSFHHAVINNDYALFQSKKSGTKFSPLYQFNIKANSNIVVRLRLTTQLIQPDPLGKSFDDLFATRIQEANEFYGQLCGSKDEDIMNIQRQAFAGMLWNKQFYYIDIPRWIWGDAGQPPPPKSKQTGRNHEWLTLNNEDIISMPDKWEYPWYAAWDLAFHCIPLAMIDPAFAKRQLVLLLREWYMNPSGQLPAYEWNFSDVNPPVHAWSCLQVYKIEKEKNGVGDIKFLKKVFSKLLINFTWWVNRKDRKGNNVFEGGFLGLDNIGVFDRSSNIPGGGVLEQADGTSWMAMYCLNMLEMALEISQQDDSFEDVTTKFFEHFVYIAASLNHIGKNWTGSWDDEEGFFYDVLAMPDGKYIPLKVRSFVGLSTLFAVLILKKGMLEKLPEFYKRLKWFLQYRKKNDVYQVIEDFQNDENLLLALVPKERLMKLMKALLDEREFLSACGIRSISKIHKDGYKIEIEGQEFGLDYEPGEARTTLYGGNSNWRGPVWMPMNYLLVHSLYILGEYHKNDCKVEYPTGSGNLLGLKEVALELSKRLISIFQKDTNGTRPVTAPYPVYQKDEHFRDLILFYEYFHGDNARGVGASHQTGWTGVVAELIDKMYKA